MSGAKTEDDLALLALGQIQPDTNRGAGVEPCAHGIGKPKLRHCRGMTQRTVAAEKRFAISAKAPLRLVVGIEEGRASGKVRVVGVAGKQGATVGIETGDHVHPRLLALVAEHPFQVARDGYPAGATRAIAQGQAYEFYRCVKRDVHT